MSLCLPCLYPLPLGWCDQLKAKRISIDQLASMAEKDARARAARPDHCTTSAPQAFREFHQLKRIRPYFLADNLIGLDMAGAYRIKELYVLWYDNASQARANRPVK